MVEFVDGWRDVDGRIYLYCRPKSAVTENDWLEYFKNILQGYEGDALYFLIDVYHVEENMGINGFEELIQFLQSLVIYKARFAILSGDNLYPMLAKLFETVAQHDEFDLKARIFKNQDHALTWLSGC